jgi:hypothetical protein
LVGLAVLALACGPSRAPVAPVPPTSRGVLAISTVPRLQPPPGVRDYLDAIDLVRGVGARGAFESASWSDLDSAAGLKKTADAVSSSVDRGNEVLLTIKVLDTTVNALPADLRSSTFDSTAVTGRFHQLLDALRPAIGGVRYLSIGNEVDVYLVRHPEAFLAYQRFYADAVAYVHATMPGVAVGVTSTFGGASMEQMASLNGLSDVVVLTYYPLGPRFTPRPRETAGPDFTRMLAIAGDHPLVLQEVGYPSDPRLSSSEGAQAAFVGAVFAAWRAAGTRIPLLNWFALHDFTPELCRQLDAYYGAPGDPNFGAFLCSLGLRRVDGTAKPAWPALVTAAGLR